MSERHYLGKETDDGCGCILFVIALGLFLLILGYGDQLARALIHFVNTH